MTTDERIKILMPSTRRGPRLMPSAGVEGRLAAAGLLRRIIHGVPKLLQDLDHADPDLGKTLVNEAWDE